MSDRVEAPSSRPSRRQFGVGLLLEFLGKGKSSGETPVSIPATETNSTSRPLPQQRIIRNPQDFYGGLALVGLALFALWASSDLPGMRGFAFGPGTAPRLFAVLLGVTGAVVALIGFFIDGPALDRYAIRGPLFVVAAILFFAVSIRPLGLVITSFITVLISAAATKDVRWIEALIWAAFLSAFCAFLFPYALNLPLQLWPRF